MVPVLFPFCYSDTVSLFYGSDSAVNKIRFIIFTQVIFLHYILTAPDQESDNYRLYSTD